MIPTLYEIETNVRKASVAVGLPFGLAEDCGQAAAWLAVQGYDGVHAALQSIRLGMRKTDYKTNSAVEVEFRDAFVTVCGSSAIDLLVSGDVSTVRLMGADSPLLMIGYAGVSSVHHGQGYRVSFSNGSTATVSSNGVSLSGELPLAACDVTLSRHANIEAATKPTGEKPGLVVKDAVWREVMALAAKTYVPESQSSRAGGAGAGMTDND